MSVFSTNLRAIAETMMLGVKRGRGIGPRHARRLAGILQDCARDIEKQETKVAKLSAIVRDLQPATKRKPRHGR